MAFLCRLCRQGILSKVRFGFKILSFGVKEKFLIRCSCGQCRFEYREKREILFARNRPVGRLARTALPSNVHPGYAGGLEGN